MFYNLYIMQYFCKLCAGSFTASKLKEYFFCDEGIFFTVM